MIPAFHAAIPASVFGLLLAWPAPAAAQTTCDFLPCQIFLVYGRP